MLRDLAGGKFFIFGTTIWPQDFILLCVLLIICAFGLFFITVFAGRVWCGYACPQSVFTWVFMWAEKVTEGDRNQRTRLDAAPWSPGMLSPEKLVIASGAMEALNLCRQCVTRPGDLVAIESSAFYATLQVPRAPGAESAGDPCTPSRRHGPTACGTCRSRPAGS